MTQAELIAAQAQLMVDMEHRLNTVETMLLDVGSKAEEAVSKLDTAIKVYSKPDKDHWQDDMAEAIQGITKLNGWSEPKFRGLLYKELEEAAGKNINTRLTNLKKRMRKSGMRYRDADRLTKLDAIAADKDLRMMFEGIVKKYQARQGGGRELNVALLRKGQVD